MNNRLEPDRNEIEIFFDAVLRYRGDTGYLSLRAFDHDNNSVFAKMWAAGLNGDGAFQRIVDHAMDMARRAANYHKPAVFCPPIAVFNAANGWQAREEDLLLGLALSVECDEHPEEARCKLQAVLGEATAIVRSGGQWVNGDGRAEDKLHLHWRLRTPAAGDGLAKLKEARRLATAIAGGDYSNITAVHPIRWPGSWHRKGTPRLCAVVTVNPDTEIDLDEALAALKKAAPETAAKMKEGRSPGEWRDRLATDVPEGARNTTAASIAGMLLCRSVDPAIVLELLLPWNAVRCQPPLDPNELVQIINSITRRERQRRA